MMDSDETATVSGAMPDPQQPIQSCSPPPPPSPYEKAPRQPSPYAPASSTPSPYATHGSSYGAPRLNSGKAVGALICGIFSLVFAWTVIVGIVLGIVALVLASQASRECGAYGKVTAARVCAVFGLAASAFMLVLGLLVGHFVMADPDVRRESPVSGPTSAPFASDAETAAAARVARETLDAFADPDDALVASIAERADRAFFSSTDFHLAEVGIDERAFAAWLMSDLTYDIGSDDAFAHTDGTAMVFATVKSHTMFEFDRALRDLMKAEGDVQGAMARRDAYERNLKPAMDAAARSESFISLDLTASRGTWKVDEDSFEEAVQQMFSLW